MDKNLPVCNRICMFLRISFEKDPSWITKHTDSIRMSFDTRNFSTYTSIKDVKRFSITSFSI